MRKASHRAGLGGKKCGANMANDQEGVLRRHAHLRRRGTLTTKLASGDAARLTLFDTLAPTQPEAALELAIASRSSSWSPARPRWLGIDAPLCQAALMGRFQDGSGVRGVHLPDVSTFFFKSSLMLAAICSPGLAALSAGLTAGKDQGPTAPCLQTLPQTPALPQLEKPSC